MPNRLTAERMEALVPHPLLRYTQAPNLVGQMIVVSAQLNRCHIEAWANESGTHGLPGTSDTTRVPDTELSLFLFI